MESADATGVLGESTPVGLVLAFVNTHADAGGAVEQFGDADDFGEWLRSRGFGGEQMVVTGADAASARELRDALIDVMLTHSGDEGATGNGVDRATVILRESARRHPLVPVIEADGVHLVSEQSGVPFALGSVLAAVAELALSGNWKRVKACRNPPCHCGFIDRTRNGSGAFCSAGCRSQASMRAFRHRQKQA